MKKLRVLIIDDDPQARLEISRLIRDYQVEFPFVEEDFQFVIEEVATGEGGIELIEKNPPDIVLVDNIMPGGVHGIDVLKHINDKQYDSLVVLMSTQSYASLTLAVEAKKLGVFDVISKPFRRNELRSIMETLTKHLFLVRMSREMTKAGRNIRFQFLSVLSHELKAPINAIEGYLQMVQRKELGDKVDDYELIIERCIKRVKGMRHLIMDLLDLTRVEAGTKTRELKRIDVKEIAKLSIDTLKPYAIQKDIKINLKVAGRVHMKADPKEIEIIFNNLISNAIKYNNDGGMVDINIHSERKWVTLVVRDTGIGISQNDAKKLFKDFYRIKNPKTKHINGSGLGLSITKKITELYGGEISVDSTEGHGSTFKVTLKSEN